MLLACSHLVTACTYVLLSVLALSHFVLSFLVKKKKKLSISLCIVLVLCSSLASSFFTWYQSLVQAREAKGQGTGVSRQLGLHGKTTPDEDGPFTTLKECVEILQLFELFELIFWVQFRSDLVSKSAVYRDLLYKYSGCM